MTREDLKGNVAIGLSAIAAFAALGGPAVAADGASVVARAAGLVDGRSVKKNSITGKQIKDGTIGGRELAGDAVASEHIDDGAVTAEDLDPAVAARVARAAQPGPAGAAGSAGPAGEQGPKGDTGPAGPSYSAGEGLTLAGTVFSANFDALQRRVTASCPAGQAIRAIAAAGTVTCEADDVGTGSGGGAPTGAAGGALAGTYPNPALAANAVTTGNVAADTLTAADLAVDSVGLSELQNNSVGVGTIADQAVNSAKVSDNSLTAADLAVNAVGFDEIAADAVGNLQLRDDAVNGSNVVDSSLTAADLAVDSVGLSELQNNSVGVGTIADQAVNSAKVSDGSLTAADLAPGAAAANLWKAEPPAGTTARGMIHGYMTGSGRRPTSSINYPWPMPSAPTLQVVGYTTTKTGCTGSIDNPQAASGYLCVYLGPGADVSEVISVNEYGDLNQGAGRWGTGFLVEPADATYPTHMTAVWALTT